jgi:hypothetical protein
MEASQHSLLAACYTLHSINATLAVVPQRGAGTVQTSCTSNAIGHDLTCEKTSSNRGGEATSILNIQSLTAVSGWSSSLGVGRRFTIFAVKCQLL